MGLSNELSPVRLGVSPAAASTSTGVFSQRFEALFPHAGTLGCVVCLAPQLFLPVYLHETVGPLPLPATASLGPPSRPATLPTLVLQPPPCCESSPPFLPVWMNISLTPWMSDFHTVQFSVSSGCFLFLNLLLSFFWLCEEAQCVYLRLHLGWKSDICLGHCCAPQHFTHRRCSVNVCCMSEWSDRWQRQEGPGLTAVRVFQQESCAGRMGQLGP